MGRRAKASDVSVRVNSQHPQQLCCWVTKTNEATHEIIRGGLDRSPCSVGLLKEQVRATALALKTRFTGLPIKIPIKYFWSLKD